MDFIRSMALRDEYPGKIPVVVTACGLTLGKNKFLVSSDMSLGAFIVYLRQKHMKLGSEEAIIVFIGQNIPKVNDTIGDLDSRYRNREDNNLHLTLMKENTFGAL